MKKSIVIILYDHPLNHTSDYADQTCAYFRRHNMVISLLLKDAVSIKELLTGRGTQPLIRRITSSHIQITPLFILPFRRFSTIVKINSQIASVLVRIVAYFLNIFYRAEHTYLWIFDPEHVACVRMFSRTYKTVYDCVDYHGSDQSVGNEKQLLSVSWIVFVNSYVLYKHVAQMYQRVHLVPLGFDEKRFTQSAQYPVPTMSIRKPIIGYVGGINSRLDFPLLIQLAKRNPSWNIVLIGPIQTRETDDLFEANILPNIRRLLKQKNVHHIAQIQKGEIGSYIAQFDVSIIPYDITIAFNLMCFPMKILEYFYAGTPVVSSPIHEASRFKKLVFLAHSVPEWETAISDAISSWPSMRKKTARHIAMQNSWNAKFRKIESTISKYES